jgi:ADP-ribose pyrophosphatase
VSGGPASPRVRVLTRKRLHDGFYQFDLLSLEHERFDGGWTGPLRRELLVQRSAVAVLPYDPVADRVVLVEQFRAGCIDGPGEPWLIEVVAGLKEAGETPETVAAREIHEETGLTATGRMEFVCRYRASPGGTSEQVDVYVAEIAAPAEGGLFGAADEDEDIRTHLVAADEVFAMARDGRITAANSIIPILWLELNRERLRSVWASGAGPR